MRGHAERGESFPDADRAVPPTAVPLPGQRRPHPADRGVLDRLLRGVDFADLGNPDPMATWRDHVAIVDAIEARDLAAARDRLDQHYDGITGVIAFNKHPPTSQGEEPMKLRTFTSALALTAALFGDLGADHAGARRRSRRPSPAASTSAPAAFRATSTRSPPPPASPGSASTSSRWYLQRRPERGRSARSPTVLRGQRRPAHLHLQARRRQMARRRALHRRGREVHHRPRQERQDRLGLRRPPRRDRLGRDARRAHRRHQALARRRASMLDTLTKLMMLPEHALEAIPAEELAKNAWWSTTPIGTGPFKFVQLRHRPVCRARRQPRLPRRQAEGRAADQPLSSRTPPRRSPPCAPAKSSSPMSSSTTSRPSPTTTPSG